MSSPIFIFSGLGATSRMYLDPWHEIPGAVFVEWPSYAGEASVTTLAERMADEWRIPDDAILIGSSFGGLIACEISRLRRTRSLVLVASAVHKDEFIRSRVVEFLARHAPLPLIQRLFSGLQGALERLFAHEGNVYNRAVLDSIQMFSTCDPKLYRAMFLATYHWGGYLDGPCRPIRIHGRHDGVIHFPGTADLVLDGGHLIARTHADECVSYIRNMLEIHCPK